MPTWQSWAGTVRARPARVLRPRTAEQACAALRSVGPWRPVGAGCSASPLVVTEGTLVDGRGLDGVGVVRDGRVVVGGGVTIGALARALAEQGYRLPPVGSSSLPTVAGGLATGLHGTGRDHGTLSDAAWVRGVELVTPAGERVVLSDRRPGDAALLAAARAHLGLLGLVVSVELAVVSGAATHQRREVAPLADAVDPAFGEGWDHVDVWWLPGTGDALVTRRRAARGSAPPSQGAAARRLLLEDLPLRAVVAAARWPAGLTAGQRLVRAFAGGPVERVARWDSVAVGPRWLRAVDAEFALPAASLPAALEAVAELVHGLHLPVNLRWTRADEGALLSSGLGRDTAWLDVAWHPARGCDVLDELRRRLAPFAPRAHWGKVGAGRALPAAFEAARQQLDPEGVLLHGGVADVVAGPVAW